MKQEEELKDEELYLKSKIVAEKIPVRRDDLNNRWYQYKTEFKRGWTTLADETMAKGPGLERWLGNSNSYKDAMDYARVRADLGSRLHTVFAQLVWGAEIDMQGMEREEILRIMEFAQFWEQVEPIPIATEYPMWNDDFLYAGTADFICYINDSKGIAKRYLLDWKTGGLYDESFRYQLSAYKYLAEKVFNFKIDEIAIVQFKGTHRGSCNVSDRPKYNFKRYAEISYEGIMDVCRIWERKKIEQKFPEKLPEKIKLKHKEKGEK